MEFIPGDQERGDQNWNLPYLANSSMGMNPWLSELPCEALRGLFEMRR